MSGVGQGPQLAVWHYRDRSRVGQWTLCGLPWSEPVGIVQPCTDCFRLKAAARDTPAGGVDSRET